MSFPAQDPYITEWMPMIGGFKPMQVIVTNEETGEDYEPREKGKYVSNAKWLADEAARIRDVGIKCHITSIRLNGLTMLAIRKGDEE